MGANVYVMDLGEPLGRPFVFVEGIDFGLSGNDGPHQLGDFGWSAFNGCDIEAYPMMAGMPALIDSLVERGFHPVLIDFGEGAGDIHSNAVLLTDILGHLVEYRTNPAPMVVSGASMGGQIARIALGMMEQAGQPHCTQLYLSLDSPHEGANVPLGLQQLIGVLTESNGSVEGLSEALSSPAARQLLLRQDGPMVFRHQYRQLLEEVGWPKRCHKAGIANGGHTPISEECTPLLDYEYTLVTADVLGDLIGLLDLEVHPYPGDPDHPLASPLFPVTSLVEMPEGNGWPWPLEMTVGTASDLSQHWSPSLDLMPGGTRPSMVQFAETFNQAVANMDIPWPLSIPPIQPWEYQPLHCFIPTPSALGIPPPWNESTMDSLALMSPFDSVHIAPENEPHSEINTLNSEFVLNQIDWSTCPISPGWVSDTVQVHSFGNWSLPDLTIDGLLALQSAHAMFGAQAAPTGSHGLFHLHPCGSGITIKPTGTLQIGGGYGPNAATAELVLSAGSILRIEGDLRIGAGSQLRLEPGSVLQLVGGHLHQSGGSVLSADPGSAIMATGAVSWHQEGQSTLIADTDIELSDADWTHHLASMARIHVPHGAHFLVGTESSATWTGFTQETNWVVASGAEVRVEGSGSWRHEKAGIRLFGSAKWTSNLTGGVEFHDSRWTGSETDTISISGALTLENHQSDQLTLHQAGGEFRAYNSDFNEGHTFLDNNRIRWRHCDFTDHPVVHHSLGLHPSHLMESCQFIHAGTGLSIHGPGTLRMEDCVFASNAVGLLSQNSAVELSCVQFHSNDTGILADRSQLFLEPTSGGGWNVFDGNHVHMRFSQAPLPLIEGGANHFGNHYSAWATGTLELNCSGAGLDWAIHGQSWNWPVSWPQIQSGLWAMGPDGAYDCPVTALDLSPVESAECRELERKKSE